MKKMMKDSVVRFWLTHHYLKRIAKKYPLFFDQLMYEVCDNKREQLVMEKRYLERTKFEAIAIDMNVSDRYIFRIHQKVIDRLIEL